MIFKQCFEDEEGHSLVEGVRRMTALARYRSIPMAGFQSGDETYSEGRGES